MVEHFPQIFLSAIWQHAAHTTNQFISPSCWTEVIQKSLSLYEKYWRIFWKKFRRKDQQAEKDKIERVTGIGRRTREETAKWNQMTALMIPDRGKTSDIPGLPSGDTRRGMARNENKIDKLTFVSCLVSLCIYFVVLLLHEWVYDDQYWCD